MNIHWISVKRARPDDWQEVLIGWDTPRGLRYTGDVHEATFRVYEKDRLVYWDQGTARWIVGDKNAPTHWAPMPARPRKRTPPP